MAKSQDEKFWGVQLSIAARELPMTLGLIEHTCDEIKKRCDQLGKDKLSTTPEGQRLRHLMTMVGGLKYMMEGVDGMLNALIFDLLKDFREEAQADDSVDTIKVREKADVPQFVGEGQARTVSGEKKLVDYYKVLEWVVCKDSNGLSGEEKILSLKKHLGL